MVKTRATRAQRHPRAHLVAVAFAGAVSACAANPGWAPPPLRHFPAPVDEPYPIAAPPAEPPSLAPITALAPEPAHQVLAPDQTRLHLPGGRQRVVVHVPSASYVSVGLHGPADALVDVEVRSSPVLVGLRPLTAIDEDRRLPAFLSFVNHGPAHALLLEVETSAPAYLSRTSADAGDIAPRARLDLLRGLASPRPLVGMPFPFDPRAGYHAQVPQRYQFIRADVARALREALRQTRVRFGRNSLALGDMTQWDGKRPASDLGRPRHISHGGGRDVDIALPAREGASEIRRRCEGVMVERDVLQCEPGTLQDFDALRLAYLLGLLIDGPTPDGRYIADARKRPGPIAPVETIFTDQLYIDAIQQALQVLRRRHWIHDEAYGQLGEEGVLRPSAWHVDHVHIRFKGEDAVVRD